jgi:hypothetical protein
VSVGRGDNLIGIREENGFYDAANFSGAGKLETF